MKKKLFFCMIIMFFSVLLFAETDVHSERIKDAENRKLTLLASEDGYSLYQDKNGTLYLYSENWLFDEIYLYKENGTSNKEKIQSKMKEASDVSKIIDSDYIVYLVNMGFFAPTYYYVKTPKGNFYSVSEKIKTINASANNLIDEL